MLINERLMGLMALLLPLAALADGAGLVQAQCASCHAVEPPGFAAAPVVERTERKAPPLHYAGSKYRLDWLVAWLQQPDRLYPAGYTPTAYVTHTDDGDQVDPAALPEHPALAEDAAREAAEYLMTLQAEEGLIEPGAYEPGSVALRMGQMDFRKFKGCNACHQDVPGEGGVSGPELHSAWARLQPAFIYAYVKNPTAWDPHSMMPVPDMNEAAVAKLVNYLKAIGEQQP